MMYQLRQLIALVLIASFTFTCSTTPSPQPQADLSVDVDRVPADDPPSDDEEDGDGGDERLADSEERGAIYEYDAGPDVTTEVGRKYAQLFASTPNYRKLGEAGFKDDDKFRWKFGPMFYRGRLGENQVKVLIIGQEGAQDENISDRSFTGGTGGRMQHTLHALGLDRSYLFINTFVYTISDQYAEFAPMLFRGELTWRNLLSNETFLLSQDPRSPIVKHRHAVIDHVIDSNKDSLKLIIAVGGAAQDSLSTYIMAKGGTCLPTISKPENIQLVKYGSAFAGGNRKFYYPVDEKGKNLLLAPGESGKPDYGDNKIQNEHKSRAYKDSPHYERIMNGLVKQEKGKLGNGLNDLRQTTMNLSSCVVDGKKNSLKGLNGVPQDIRFIKVKHPGSNSPTLQSDFQGALALVRGWSEEGSGWKLPKDEGVRQQNFDRDYRYSHRAVPRRDFRFGLSEIIGQGTTNSTRRDGGAAIEFGSRDGARHEQLKDAYRVDDAYAKTDYSWEPNRTRYTEFDAGPGIDWTRIFTNDLPEEKLLKLVTQTQPKFGALSIYRGRPSGAEVLVVADQTSHDDLWAGRALMGLEGQKLQGFLTGIGAGTNYVILRTLPVDTIGEKPDVINKMMDVSSDWRKKVMSEIISQNKNSLKMILTLGSQADKTVSELPQQRPEVISLTGGYEGAFSKIKAVSSWGKSGMKLITTPMPIARVDVPYGMRRWTGTSGDRVSRAVAKVFNKKTRATEEKVLYKIQAPQWGVKNQPARALTNEEAQALRELGIK